ncbi:MAG TPA: hypothetical protein VGD05_08845 [Pyrinomonadaceae bacterium]
MNSAARSVKVVRQTIGRWRDSYPANSLHFLFHHLRAGRPHSFDGAQRAKITALACSQPPLG